MAPCHRPRTAAHPHGESTVRPLLHPSDSKRPRTKGAPVALVPPTDPMALKNNDPQHHEGELAVNAA